MKGYRATHRNRWTLLKRNILTAKEFLLFEYYLDLMDWDPKHRIYGEFQTFLEDTATVFDLSEDAIRIWHNGLVSKNFILLVSKRLGKYKIKNPSRYLLDGRKGGKASEFGKQENEIDDFETVLKNICFSQQKIEKNQQNTIKSASTYVEPLISSKVDDLSMSPIRTREEYRQIKKELDFKLLTEEDMEWIDANVRENIVGTG